MKKPVMYTLMVLLAMGAATSCSSRKAAGTTTKVSKNSPVPANAANNDSTGTTPTPKLTPSPIPNTRPNPIPNPPPPNPPER